MNSNVHYITLDTPPPVARIHGAFGRFFSNLKNVTKPVLSYGESGTSGPEKAGP